MKICFYSLLIVLMTAVTSHEVLALNVGDQVPDIAVASTEGQPVNLRDVEGWKVVYFYPKSFTPGCTKQACGLRDSSARYDELNATLFGVSVDSLETQRRFKSEYNLPFAVLADKDKTLTRAFDALGFAGMAKRMTFIIDPEGRVADIIGSVSVSSHDDDVAERLKALQNPD